MEAGRPEGSFVLAKSNLVLDGSVLLVKGAEFGDTYKGLRAQVEVSVTYDFDFWGRLDHKIPIPVFRGWINLISLPNGKPFFYTAGNINRFLHVSSVMQDEDSFVVNFDDVEIPYRVLTRVGSEYELTTKITSRILTQGDGTGAEVLFGPGTALVPEFAENQAIPEPATLLAVGLGSLMVMRKRRLCRRQ
jgi:hypothetical protein